MKQLKNLSNKSESRIEPCGTGIKIISEIVIIDIYSLLPII